MKSPTMHEWMSKELVNRYNFAEDDTCATWYFGLIVYDSDECLALRNCFK